MSGQSVSVAKEDANLDAYDIGVPLDVRPRLSELRADVDNVLPGLAVDFEAPCLAAIPLEASLGILLRPDTRGNPSSGLSSHAKDSMRVLLISQILRPAAPAIRPHILHKEHQNPAQSPHLLCRSPQHHQRAIRTKVTARTGGPVNCPRRLQVRPSPQWRPEYGALVVPPEKCRQFAVLGVLGIAAASLWVRIHEIWLAEAVCVVLGSLGNEVGQAKESFVGNTCDPPPSWRAAQGSVPASSVADFDSVAGFEPDLVLVNVATCPAKSVREL